MFERLSEEGILEKLKKRKTDIRKLDKLPLLDGFYLSVLSKYEGIEITPDIEIFGYEKALKENRYLETHFPGIHQIVWMMGRTGQGDEWFMNKESGSIWFYDHNRGEYAEIEQFINLNISFFNFLQMAFLYQDLEKLLDYESGPDNEQRYTFINAVNAIAPGLYELYPFQYF